MLRRGYDRGAGAEHQPDDVRRRAGAAHVATGRRDWREVGGATRDRSDLHRQLLEHTLIVGAYESGEWTVSAILRFVWAVQTMLVVWRRGDLPLDRETVDGIIRMLMAINAKLERLLGEEEDDASEDES